MKVQRVDMFVCPSAAPADTSGFGFDNVGDVLSVSPGLLDRYLMAARKISDRYAA